MHFQLTTSKLLPKYVSVFVQVNFVLLWRFLSDSLYFD
ncbi:hypothetical protein T12_820 [Trichinella patagoniensis]|uniref:Uncharacterized protein n=1 Tax=Trichinella patagoniensis TaxID=990121 RepID=A0A0V0XES5_9BILA|nr:hypothetical protein T12_820 [Trichinella patagoniensis]